MKPGAASAGWLVPDWPVPAPVQALCSTRHGGVSAAPYDSLNLGDHVGDAPQAVAENRARWSAALGSRPVFLQQVHGTGVVQLTTSTADGTQADACVCTVRGLACTIMVADCLPVLFASVHGRAVAAAHAGWRGLCGPQGRGVLETTWDAFWPHAGRTPQEAAAHTVAWLGPCIGPQAFEVGAEVKQAFVEATPSDARYFVATEGGKWHADLPGLARRRLHALGIRSVHGNDGSAPWCTVSDASRFFSHRRDRVSGRLAASVWLG